ncbi:MAG: hypothetical protein WD556_08515 [Actinomycetota bacterium]
MPERRPPEQRRRPPEGEPDPFLDESEPDWVARLRENRKAQVKQWEQVFGTGEEQAEAPEGEQAARRPTPSEARSAPARRKLRRTGEAERRATPAFYDQDEEGP